MNRLLSRQLRRLGLDAAAPPTTSDDWAAFLARVEAAYDDADRSRYLMERSMELSARELSEAGEALADRSAQRAARSEQRYRHIFAHLPVAAWEEDFSAVAARLDELRNAGVDALDAYFDDHPAELADCVGRVHIRDFNAAVTELIGPIDRSALIGPVDPTAMADTSLASWRHEFGAIWRGEGRTQFEFEGQRLDGTPFAAKLHWNAACIDGAFDYSRVVVVVTDLSERIAAEERMRRLVAAKDEFLASVSHELRTPLTSILGFADVLRTGVEGEDERSDMIAMIADQAADLSGIVEDLLIGASADLGRLEVWSRAVDVAELVRQVVGGSRCDLIGADNAVAALADAGRVRQILRNLLSNADRYGGPRRQVEVSRHGEAVVVAVCDDGPPLDPVTADRIFDRYYRGVVTTGRPGSVGIGLTISRSLAELMGGSLGYRHDGAWARFELTLPAASVAAARTAAAAAR